MMTQNPAQIRALAFVIAAIRPAWPAKLIEESLAKSNKPFDVLADDAIDAARTPALRSPAVLATHRRPDRPLGEGTQPPPITRCARCGRATEHDHACRSVKPPWWPQAQAITNRYATAIRAARAVGDHATVAELAANQRTELAKVMSHA